MAAGEETKKEVVSFRATMGFKEKVQEIAEKLGSENTQSLNQNVFDLILEAAEATLEGDSEHGAYTDAVKAIRDYQYGA